jgi:hypothetical protein
MKGVFMSIPANIQALLDTVDADQTQLVSDQTTAAASAVAATAAAQQAATDAAAVTADQTHLATDVASLIAAIEAYYGQPASPPATSAKK